MCFAFDGVAKIAFSWKLDLGGFGSQFWRHVGTEMTTQILTILTLGSQGCQLAALGAGLDFIGFS